MKTPYANTRKNVWDAAKTGLITKIHALEKKQGQLSEKDLD